MADWIQNSGKLYKYINMDAVKPKHNKLDTK